MRPLIAISFSLSNAANAEEEYNGKPYGGQRQQIPGMIQERRAGIESNKVRTLERTLLKKIPRLSRVQWKDCVV